MSDTLLQATQTVTLRTTTPHIQSSTNLSGCNYIPLVTEELSAVGTTKFLNPIAAYSSDLQNTIAVCLTAYNEHLNAYQASLSALCQSAQYCRLMGETNLSEQLLICILVDGLESMDLAFSTYAQELGIYNPDLLDAKAHYHIFEAKTPRVLLDSNNSLINKKAIAYDDTDVQKILLIIKNKNHGKLHSHKCFFDIACRLYLPNYFLQIDVGTTPDANAIYQMWKHLNENPRIAATAARSHLPSPANKLDLLGIWQFCDITLERVVNWPTEIMMGNLSVLPGQLSLTRMTSVLGQNSVDPNSPKVLDNYYKGLRKLSPLEANMYLAEDRILGLEMVFQNKNQWELNYATKAEATVDACESWGELLRQRRRWICSSIACRVSMLSRLPIIFRNQDRSFAQQTHKLLAAIYSIIFSTFCWFVPSIHLTLQTALSSVAIESLSSNLSKDFLLTLWLVTCLSLFPQIYFSFKRKITSNMELPIAISLYIQTANIVFSSIVLIVNTSAIENSPLLITCFISMLLGYSFLCLAYSRRLFFKTIQDILPYSVARPSIASFLMTYSIINCHDTSWGTKGLELEKGNLSNNIYRRFRNKVATIFLLTNLLMFGLLCFTGAVHSLLSVITIISFTLIQITIALFAFCVNKLFLSKTNKRSIS